MIKPGKGEKTSHYTVDIKLSKMNEDSKAVLSSAQPASSISQTQRRRLPTRVLSTKADARIQPSREIPKPLPTKSANSDGRNNAPSRRPPSLKFAPSFVSFNIHGNNHSGVPPATAGNAPFNLASLTAASTSNAGDLSAFVGFGATNPTVSPMFSRTGPSGSGFGGFPAIPSTSTATSGLMLPNTSTQAPDTNVGIPNETYLTYLMLLNQQGSETQIGLRNPVNSGSTSTGNFLLMNPGLHSAPQMPPLSVQQSQPSLLSVLQAQQHRSQPPDYTALSVTDTQQSHHSTSFTSPSIHLSPQQLQTQKLEVAATFNALQALQQSPSAAFLQALMPSLQPPHPPQPQSQPTLQQHFLSEEFLLNELQRELNRREAAAIQAQQQAQQIQAFQQAIQQGIIPVSQTQQLLALLQQQFRPSAPQPSPPPPFPPAPMVFGASNLGTPRPPMTSQMTITPTFNPGLNLTHSNKPSTSSTPNLELRLTGPDDTHKKLSQSSIIPVSASTPKRNSVSSLQPPISTKMSTVSTPQKMQPSGSLQSPPRMVSSFCASMSPSQVPLQQLQQPSLSQMPPPQPMYSTPSSSTAPGPSTSAGPSTHRNQAIEPTGLPLQPYYPTHFFKGTAIKMADGVVKTVENLQATDFANSRLIQAGLKLSVGKLVDIKSTPCCKQVVVRYLADIDGENSEGIMTANCEYPFYEVEHGWSSYDPPKTLNLYGLKCRPIALGDKYFILTQLDETSETLPAEQTNRGKKPVTHCQQPSSSESRPSSRSATSQRANRKSIPPPSINDAATTSTTFPPPQQTPTECLISSSSNSSMTPASLTISAPVASSPRPVFNLESSSTSNSNAIKSPPAAVDNSTVAESTKASTMDVDKPGPSGSSSRSSYPQDNDFILDFNI